MNTSTTDGRDGLLHRQKSRKTFSDNTYLEPADVKSPHTSELGWAAGTGDPKSNKGTGYGDKPL